MSETAVPYSNGHTPLREADAYTTHLEERLAALEFALESANGASSAATATRNSAATDCIASPSCAGCSLSRTP